MGNDLNSKNDLINSLNNSVMQDSWMKNIYGESRKTQKAELKKVFTVIDDNNVSASEKKALQARAKVLKDKLDRLEAKMAKLAEELDKNQALIDKEANAIADLVAAAGSKSQELEKEQHKIVKTAVDDVFKMYRNNQIGRDAIVPEIRTRIKASTYKLSTQAEIEKILAKLDNKRNELDGLIGDATGWLDDSKLLDSQLGVAKSTYNMINRNLEKIGNTDTSYKNSDYDNVVPVYSLAKTDIVSDFFDDASINVPSTNTNYTEGSKESTIASVITKHQANLGVAATTSDPYVSGNAAVSALSRAMSAGLFTDLLGAGMSADEVYNFLATNFAGAGIKKTSNGSLSVPYGHDKSADAVYSTLISQINAFNTRQASLQGSVNTWDQEAGNTISSNAQIAALGENYAEIIEKLGKGDPAFSFKEGMYALFNPETGLFKNSGVVYDAKDATNAAGQPKYYFELAGDAETANMYKGLADKIFEVWGVRPTQTISAVRDQSTYINLNPPPPPAPKSRDPLTFTKDNIEYAFVIDRNKDGALSGMNEFLGAEEGTSWLDDLKSLDLDGDGKLTGDELKNLKILSSGYQDNAQETRQNGFLRGTTTQINYEMTTAAGFGIEEIDLAGLENSVNNSTGKFDINGSEIFNDSFNFKVNGETITASRKDDTSEFMKAVYGDAIGKSFTVGLTDEEADSLIVDGYSIYDEFAQKYGGTLDQLVQISNIDTTAGEARVAYNNTVARVNADEKAQLQRAENKANSYDNTTNWNSVKSKVQQIAAQKGIAIDMEQAKGIFVGQKGITADQIVEKYQALVESENKIKNDQANYEIAWQALELCVRNKVKATTSEITELLSSGKAKTAEDVMNILKQKAADDKEEQKNKDKDE